MLVKIICKEKILLHCESVSYAEHLLQLQYFWIAR